VPREAVASADFIQFSGYSLVCDTTRDMMRRTIAQSRPTPFGFDPASAAFIREFGAERVLAETGGAAVIFPNEDEAEALTGAKGPIEQVEALGRFYPLVVLKRGRRGCLAFGGGAMVEAPAPDVGAIDSTGAGDAFVAAFLADHLRGRTLEVALRSAVAAGALAVQTLGAAPKS
jgi:sugar/nucleoside kinase (ribokinase family)